MYIKNIYIYILIILITLLTTGFATAEMTASQIAKKYSPSVVTIVALDENDQPLSLGSGFFINTEGNIVTNHHVLEGCAKAIIKTTQGKKGKVIEIINDDPELDLLIAKTSLKNTTPLPLGDSNTITVGEDIIAIGNPAGLEGTVSMGIISRIRKVEDYKLIQITSPISPGSSGGPVFNLSGEVIGIATAYLDYGQSLNFAMPVNYLKSLKPRRIKLDSLPKRKIKKRDIEDKTLVRLIDIDKFYIGGISTINFGIKNLSNYPIKNIKLFFMYKDYRGEVISYSRMHITESILPKLALQFKQMHEVRNLNAYMKNGKTHPTDSEYPPFGHGKDLFLDIDEFIRGKIDIRILDYDIERLSSQMD